ncbi:MAG: transporter ATP-binding protein [Rhizobacter sp.]|nr:transporter ATP-binding protein [Rhizobacter sp.]
MAPSAPPRFVQTHVFDADASREEAAAGLLAPAAHASPKFFYDRLGSKLFEAITEVPEYYPTRTEAAVLANNASSIAAAVGKVGSLVDLGAGNCAKAARLFPTLGPRRYVAVDISVDFLRDALRGVQREHPELEMIGLGTDFSSQLKLPPDIINGRPVFFYPGSSIGNFTPEEAVPFLRSVRANSRDGGMLLGVDLRKAPELLVAAYDDALGVTAAFNLNVLRHLNRIVGTDFDPAQWKHVALFNDEASRIEMHLQARVDVAVTWPGHERTFAAGERIHTENSYKYTVESFERLLKSAGFCPKRHWTDERGFFGVFWAESQS